MTGKETGPERVYTWGKAARGSNLQGWEESSGGLPSGLGGNGLEVGNGAQARTIWDLDRAGRRWCRAEASLGRAQLTFPQLPEWRQSKTHGLRPGLKAP